MSRAFDAIVIGAGQAGPSLAARLAASGMKVAIVERKLVGGTCVNTGCMPTKTLVASARAAQIARRGEAYGVRLPGPISLDMAMVKARADKVTLDARTGLEAFLDGLQGVTLIRGQARFLSATEIEVSGERLTAPRIFVNVGGRAAIPDLPGVAETPFLTNTTILELSEVPEHLIIVGGSYIGLEFAQMHRRFGAQVTVVEKGPRLIAREDPEVSQTIREILEAEGVRVRLGADCISLARRPDGGVTVGVDCASSEPVAHGSHVLLAVGRRPNTDDLGIEAAGVALDARGYIPVDEGLQTSVPGIWALGDCNGRGAFTHTAYNDYEIVAANLLDGEDRKVSDRIDAYALYIDPPLGRVGMTEAQARQAGHQIQVGKRPMSRVGRAVEKGETAGFMKVVVDAADDRILGAAILGVGGDEVIHTLLDTMAAGAGRLSASPHHAHPSDRRRVGSDGPGRT